MCDLPLSGVSVVGRICLNLMVRINLFNNSPLYANLILQEANWRLSLTVAKTPKAILHLKLTQTHLGRHFQSLPPDTGHS